MAIQSLCLFKKYFQNVRYLCFQGLEHSWQKHKKCAEMLYEGIEKLGLEFMVKDKVYNALL